MKKSRIKIRIKPISYGERESKMGKIAFGKTWLLLSSASLLLMACGQNDERVEASSAEESPATSQTTTANDQSKVSKPQDESTTSESENQSSSVSESTTSTDEGSETETDQASVVDYFPLTTGYASEFAGTGNEYAGFNRTYDYIEDNNIFMRTNNGGTSVLEVVEVTEDAARVVYSQPEYYAHEKMDIEGLVDPEKVETLLEAPIELGHSWESGTGTTREITAIGVPMSTQQGLYDTIEVTEDTGDFVIKEYYAAGVGLVYTSNNATDPDAPYTVIQDLANLSTEGWPESVSLYYPSGKDDYTHADESMNITTNDDMAVAFTSLFQSEGKNYPQLLPDDAEIVSLQTKTNEETREKTLHIEFSPGITALADDELGMQKFNSMMATLKGYYNADYLEPRVEGQPIEIEGLVRLNEANPLFEVPEGVMAQGPVQE